MQTRYCFTNVISVVVKKNLNLNTDTPNGNYIRNYNLHFYE